MEFLKYIAQEFSNSLEESEQNRARKNEEIMTLKQQITELQGYKVTLVEAQEKLEKVQKSLEVERNVLLHKRCISYHFLGGKRQVCKTRSRP